MLPYDFAAAGRLDYSLLTGLIKYFRCLQSYYLRYHSCGLFYAFARDRLLGDFPAKQYPACANDICRPSSASATNFEVSDSETATK
jgi:hypothetical protein